MSKATWINVDGVWKKCKATWINVDGVWKKIIDKINVNGTWKQCISYSWEKIVHGNSLYASDGYIYNWSGSNLDIYNDYGELILTETDKYIVRIIRDGNDVYKISTYAVYKNDVEIFKNTSYRFDHVVFDKIKKEFVLVQRRYSDTDIIYKMDTNGNIIARDDGFWNVRDIYADNGYVYVLNEYTNPSCDFRKITLDGIHSATTIFEVINVFPNVTKSQITNFAIKENFAYCFIAKSNQCAKINLTTGEKTLSTINDSSFNDYGVVVFQNYIIRLARIEDYIKLIKYDLNFNKILEKTTPIDDLTNMYAYSLYNDVSTIYYIGRVNGLITIFKDEI